MLEPVFRDSKLTIEVACNDLKFLDTLENELKRVEYNSSDIESRIGILVTILNMKKYIELLSDLQDTSSYNYIYDYKGELKEINNPNVKDYEKRLSEIVCNLVEKLNSDDFKIFYRTVGVYFPDYLNEAVRKQILSMSEEDFCIFQDYTKNFKRLDESLFKIIEEKKSFFDSSSFFDYFMRNKYSPLYYSFKKTDLDNLEKFSDLQKARNLFGLRETIRDKYVYCSRIYPEVESERLKEEESVLELQNKSEYKEYLRILETMSDDLFANFIISSHLLKQSERKEKEILDARLRKLSLTSLLAMLKCVVDCDDEHYIVNIIYENGTEKIKEILDETRDEYGNINYNIGYYDIEDKIDDEMKRQVEIKGKIYAFLRNPDISYREFTFSENVDDVSQKYLDELRKNKIESYWIDMIKYIYNLSDKDFIKFAINYNKEHSQTPDLNISQSETVNKYYEDIMQNIKYSIIERIILLPQDLKAMLLYSAFQNAEGILSNEIVSVCLSTDDRENKKLKN